ncbi:hypothetical protein V8E54_002560 [Elaphomyces granulatus]
MPLNPAEPARQLSHDIRWRLKSIQTMPATRNRIPFPDANWQVVHWQTAYYWLNIAYQPTCLPACLPACTPTGQLSQKSRLSRPSRPSQNEPTEPNEPNASIWFGHGLDLD